METDEIDGRKAGRHLSVTERSAAADAMFRQIVECGNQGVWVLDVDGTTVYANRKLASMLGYTVEEMLSLSLPDLLDEVGKGQGAAFLARQREAGGTTESAESLLVRKDGAPVWTAVTHSPWRSEDGQHLGLIAFVSDITDSRHLHEELRQREDQLAEAQRVAHLGSWEWEIAADQVRWSDELYRIFGLAPNEFEATFQGYLSMVHPDDRQITTDSVTACLEGEPGFEFDQRVVRRDGQVVWVRASGELLRDAEGRPLLMRGTALNITAFKEAQEALQRTTARYQLLQRMASAANAAEDLKDGVRLAVREMCAHLQWPAGRAYLVSGEPPQLSAAGSWQLNAERRLIEPTAPAEDSDELGGPATVTELATDAWSTGQPRWRSRGDGLGFLELSSGASSTAGFAFPVFSGGQVVAVLEFVTDSTVRPSEAVKLSEQVGTQLARVAEREQANRELLQARDTALQAVRAKSAFLATMSHEIRTPMNGVIGLTDLLLGTELTERQRQYAEGVHGAGEALLAIINDILDFSKIEAGKLDLETINFDVTQIVEEVAGLVARQAHSKGLELIAHGDLGLPTGLRGDPARLRQVLLNLTSNAIKFTEQGEVILRARILDETDTAVHVRFEVADTGIGVSPQDQQRLFDPFSQIDASTTRRFGGTGLGLAISKQLVEAMGGHLSVASAVGEGSTFAFTLPLTRGEAISGFGSSPRQHLLDGIPVLVVDDNETNRLILRDQLAALDMEPQLAQSGAAAMQLLHAAAQQNQLFGIALLDMNMPGMDGIELARRISRDPALSGTRLIILTSTDANVTELQDSRVSACLTKPVRSSQLYDCIMRVVAPATKVPPFTAPVPAAPELDTECRLLVVEDNVTNQLVARGMLHRLGYRVDVAANGREALEALRRTEYVAVLMDCQMPEMDGYTATGEIRSGEISGQHMPIIAMTAGAMKGDQERCLAAGMDDYIAKPIKHEDLEAILNKWVQHD